MGKNKISDKIRKIFSDKKSGLLLLLLLVVALIIFIGFLLLGNFSSGLIFIIFVLIQFVLIFILRI